MIFARTKPWVIFITIYHILSLLLKYICVGGEVANVVLNRYGAIDYEWGIHSASTDFVSDFYFSFLAAYYLCI